MDGNKLCDLDCADDIALIETSQMGMQLMTEEVDTISRRVGLRMKVGNEDIRKKTGSRKLEDIIKERRLRWLGHVLRMDNSRTARQATRWELSGLQEKARTTEEELGRCHQTRPQTDGLDLGRSRRTGE